MLGSEHTDVAGTLNALASLLIETGHFEDAQTAAVEARKIYEVAFPEGHWRLAAASSAEGAALAGLGQIAAAEALLLSSVTTLRNDSSAQRFYVDIATRWLADFYQQQGDLQQAKKYRDQ
jgi:tetratricopeptide (TPR) repeat protein